MVHYKLFYQGFVFEAISKKTLGKILQGIWERLWYKNDHNYDSYKFSFIPFFSFHRNPKNKKKKQKKSNLQQLGGLVTRNSFAFCL